MRRHGRARAPGVGGSGGELPNRSTTTCVGRHAGTHTVPPSPGATTVRFAALSPPTVLTIELVSPTPHGLAASQPAVVASAAVTFNTLTPPMPTAVGPAGGAGAISRVSIKRVGSAGT